jgi:hypothetical protein
MLIVSAEFDSVAPTLSFPTTISARQKDSRSRAMRITFSYGGKAGTEHQNVSKRFLSHGSMANAGNRYYMDIERSARDWRIDREAPAPCARDARCSVASAFVLG